MQLILFYFILFHTASKKVFPVLPQGKGHHFETLFLSPILCNICTCFGASVNEVGYWQLLAPREHFSLGPARDSL